MNLTSLLYMALLGCHKGQTRFSTRFAKTLSRLRKILVLLGDPTCSVRVRGKSLYMPLSHNLPLYVGAHPHYDTLLTRISNFLRNKYGYLTCIDVGANIGDSIIACFGDIKDSFLAIEADPGFIDYLQMNCGQINNVTIRNVVCSSNERESKFSIKEGAGTAFVKEDDRGISMPTKSLAAIIKESPAYENFNFLKIDTDGHDFEVLKGAREYIKRNLPIILFECDFSENNRYVDDFVEAMAFFKEAGYSSILVYVNLGYLFGKFPLIDRSNIKYMLLYHLTSGFGYFDVLVMKEEDMTPFVESEISYFIESIPNEALRRMARVAAEL